MIIINMLGMYNNRHGKILGIYENPIKNSYNWRDEDGLTYTDHGQWIQYQSSSKDIVEYIGPFIQDGDIVKVISNDESNVYKVKYYSLGYYDLYNTKESTVVRRESVRLATDEEKWKFYYDNPKLHPSYIPEMGDMEDMYFLNYDEEGGVRKSTDMFWGCGGGWYVISPDISSIGPMNKDFIYARKKDKGCGLAKLEKLLEEYELRAKNAEALAESRLKVLNRLRPIIQFIDKLLTTENINDLEVKECLEELDKCID